MRPSAPPVEAPIKDHIGRIDGMLRHRWRYRKTPPPIEATMVGECRCFRRSVPAEASDKMMPKANWGG